MITQPTVFFVGAGASSEIGLPVGKKLREDIAAKLDIQHDSGSMISGDEYIYRSLFDRFKGKAGQVVGLCRTIADGVLLANSIDDYIDMHRDNEIIAMCGKLAITRCILEAERASAIACDPTERYNAIDFSASSTTWYPQFFVLLTQQVPRSEIESIFNNVTIITFNYDRSVEHYLVHALAKLYQLDLQAARDLVHKKLKILHVYGMVGKYFGGDDALDYGSNRFPSIDNITKSIRTYCERHDDDQTLNEMHAAVSNARRLVFLGMAYHDLNMKLITPASARGAGRSFDQKEVYATRFGINKDRNLASVCQRHLMYLSCMSGGWTDLEKYGYHWSQECRNLFSDYDLTLRS